MLLSGDNTQITELKFSDQGADPKVAAGKKISDYLSSLQPVF